MSVEIKIEGVEGISKAANSFKAMRLQLRAKIYQSLLDFGNTAVASMKKDFMSGPRPTKIGVGTGRLRSSIRFKAVSKDDDMMLTFGTDVPYAAIHEYGGRTRPHVIRPRRKPFLAYIKDGKWNYVRGQVQHPGSLIPARPFMRPGIEQELPRLQQSLRASMRAAAEGAFGGQ